MHAPELRNLQLCQRQRSAAERQLSIDRLHQKRALRMRELTLLVDAPLERASINQALHVDIQPLLTVRTD